jgi:hypothetical protein
VLVAFAAVLVALSVALLRVDVRFALFVMVEEGPVVVEFTLFEIVDEETDMLRDETLGADRVDRLVEETLTVGSEDGDADTLIEDRDMLSEDTLVADGVERLRDVLDREMAVGSREDVVQPETSLTP